jgi:hypothetical protein
MSSPAAKGNEGNQTSDSDASTVSTIAASIKYNDNREIIQAVLKKTKKKQDTTLARATSQSLSAASETAASSLYFSSRQHQLSEVAISVSQNTVISLLETSSDDAASKVEESRNCSGTSTKGDAGSILATFYHDEQSALSEIAIPGGGESSSSFVRGIATASVAGSNNAATVLIDLVDSPHSTTSIIHSVDEPLIDDESREGGPTQFSQQFSATNRDKNMELIEVLSNNSVCDQEANSDIDDDDDADSLARISFRSSEYPQNTETLDSVPPGSENSEASSLSSAPLSERYESFHAFRGDVMDLTQPDEPEISEKYNISDDGVLDVTRRRQEANLVKVGTSTGERSRSIFDTMS